MSVPCGNQLTLWKLFFGLDDKELVGILWYTVVRNKSDAKSDPCEIDQKIVAAQLDFRNQIQLMLLEERMQKFTGCTFSVQHDDRITLQFFEGKLFPLQFRKGLVCDKDIVKITDLSEGGKTAKVNVRIVSDNEIYLTVFQKFRTLDRSGIGHFYMCVRESFVETFQIRDQKIPADGVAGTDADLTAGRGCFHDLGFPALDQIDRRFDMTQKDLTFRGELNFFCASDEKNLIQFLFQCFNGLADSGL